MVTLEAIKFNHDPDSATSDALNLRKNETEFVSVPEWLRGISVRPEDSPAAYALCETQGSTITIQAKFKCSHSSVESIEVRAIDGRLNPSFTSNSRIVQIALWLLRPFLRASLGNILGEVRKRRVLLCGGESEFETFALNHVKLWDRGVRVTDITWRWQFRVRSSDEWTDFAITSHQVYAILKLPTRPWVQQPNEITNTQLPWTAVLDYACQWAVAARDSDEAAALVTRQVYDLGLRLVRYQGSPSHYAKENFDCGSFLQLLQNGKGWGQTVNCHDCAAIVSSFANILGCDLVQSRMGFGFETNPIQLIGFDRFACTSFFDHEVAWEGLAQENDELFDACLQIDADSDPSQAPQQPLVPVNLPFGKRGEKHYRYRLSKVEDCIPLGDTWRRRIGPNPPNKSPCVSEKSLEFLKQFYNFEEWAKNISSDENVAIPEAFLRGASLREWKLDGVRDSEGKQLPYAIQSRWRYVDGNPEKLLRVDVHAGVASAEVPHLLLLLLAGFHQLNVKRLKPQVLGDIAFAESGDVAVLFARSNVVCLVQSAGRETLSVMNVTEEIDEYLTAWLRTDDNR